MVTIKWLKCPTHRYCVYASVTLLSWDVTVHLYLGHTRDKNKET